MKKAIALALALSLSSGCAAYQRHPVATVAASTVIAWTPIGIGIGVIGGDEGTFMGDATKDGIAQFSILATIIAGAAIALMSPAK